MIFVQSSALVLHHVPVIGNQCTAVHSDRTSRVHSRVALRARTTYVRCARARACSSAGCWRAAHISYPCHYVPLPLDILVGFLFGLLLDEANYGRSSLRLHRCNFASMDLANRC